MNRTSTTFSGIAGALVLPVMSTRTATARIWSTAEAAT
jgi:hypothetical protein